MNWTEIAFWICVVAILLFVVHIYSFVNGIKRGVERERKRCSDLCYEYMNKTRRYSPSLTLVRDEIELGTPVGEANYDMRMNTNVSRMQIVSALNEIEITFCNYFRQKKYRDVWSFMRSRLTVELGIKEDASGYLSAKDVDKSVQVHDPEEV